MLSILDVILIPVLGTIFFIFVPDKIACELVTAVPLFKVACFASIFEFVFVKNNGSLSIASPIFCKLLRVSIGRPVTELTVLFKLVIDVPTLILPLLFMIVKLSHSISALFVKLINDIYNIIIDKNKSKI